MATFNRQSPATYLTTGNICRCLPFDLLFCQLEEVDMEALPSGSNQVKALTTKLLGQWLGILANLANMGFVLQQITIEAEVHHGKAEEEETKVKFLISFIESYNPSILASCHHGNKQGELCHIFKTTVNGIMASYCIE